MLCYYAAGCISGAAAFLVSYPLDTIKTQQQFREPRFTDAVKRIIRHRGWSGFYRGFGAPLLAHAIINAMFFGLCGDVRDFLVDSRTHKAGLYWALSSKIYHSPYHPHHKPLFSSGKSSEQTDDVDVEEESTEATFPELFISGAVAGFSLLSVSAPIDLIKTKLQSQMKRKVFKGPLDCFLAIYKDAGLKGLYRGIVPMTIRNVCSGGVRFTFVCYVLKVCEQDLFPVRGSKQTWLALGTAGLVGWVVALPFDVIKTRMQADDHRNPRFKGMTQVVREIVKTDGIRGLYRGFWNVSMRAIPLNALTFVVFDSVYHMLCHHTPMKK